MDAVSPPHIPVLAGPALEWLAVREEGVYVDATAGAGGHAALIAGRLGGKGRLIALDRDPSAVALARDRLQQYPGATVLQANYGDLAEIVVRQGLEGVDGVLIDAGVSSMQLDTPFRGFSFQVADAPLDMRMDSSSGEDAATLLARMREDALAEALRRYGDVGPARRIARTIVRRCAEGRMRRTSDLAAAVREALDFVSGEPDELRTVFQAVRILVNDEYRWLEAGLEAAVTVLRPGGRVVAISFHSGEDRIVKETFRRYARPRRECWPDGRLKSVTEPVLEILTPKPVRADDVELRKNSRAKSALLRAAQKRT